MNVAVLAQHLHPNATLSAMEMSRLNSNSIDGAGKNASSHVEPSYTDNVTRSNTQESPLERTDTSEGLSHLHENGQEYRVHGIRWFGLIQLILLNIVVSWDWLSFSPVANTAAEFYSTNPSIINWLSIAFQFAFVAAAPCTIYVLHKGGPRLAMVTASILILAGNWIRYGGTRTATPSFGLTMFGQILIGVAQPFVLSAPTYYSDLWFTPRGRISATAVMSLANPFGGAVGQLVNPFIATKAKDIPNMVLYVAIISTVASIPSFFVPAKPRTPVSPSSTHTAPGLRASWQLLKSNATFWLIVIPFWVYVGFFNSLSSLLTQVLTPYGFSEDQSGIAGAVLILVGLVSAACTSPAIDRYKAYVLMIRVLVPIIALSYLVFIWCPGSRSLAAPYFVLAVLGAASFSLVPIALEFLVEVTFPIGPEISSTLCWTGGQLFGGLFIIISDALKENRNAKPPFTMGKALVFEAVVALAVVPCVFILGRIGDVHSKRLQIDKQVHHVIASSAS